MISSATQHASHSVLQAIQTAADRTGAGFDYLLATAERESGFEIQAKSKTSSATGLFQFVEQTWLGMVKTKGAAHGLKDLADKISVGGDGRFRVDDPSQRSAILALRKDPQIASVMAGELAEQNRAHLEAALGRPVDNAELYIAHFLGAGSGAKLLKAAQAEPYAEAASLFPAAAKANRPIFFDRHGEPRSAAEVVAELKSKHGRDRPEKGAPLEIAPPPRPVESLPPRVPKASTAIALRPSFDTGKSVALVHTPLILSPEVLNVLATLDAPARAEDGGRKSG